MVNFLIFFFFKLKVKVKWTFSLHYTSKIVYRKKYKHTVNERFDIFWIFKKLVNFTYKMYFLTSKIRSKVKFDNLFW